MFFLTLLIPITFIGSTLAATADQWRGRSIYQLITDRYALPNGANANACNVSAQTWCGGTWRTIQDNLDYIQGAGFTAIWISPVSQNYEGPRTPYGDAYHGYWIADASQLNSRFGTADDLKALSAELHRRGMYLMVDVVANNVMATSINTSYSSYMFKEPTQYHPYCPIDWNNLTSIQNCWLGDTAVPLPDINTEDPTVASTYGSWIKNLVQEYGIDGLRIDAAKHVPESFWTSFCDSAGVFCMGEVFGSDISLASSYQKSMDSVLNYPLYDAIVQGFAIPGPANLSNVSAVMAQIQNSFKDPTVLGNFLENQDLPRWRSLSVDPQTLMNAMVLTFMTDGIPILYYGQEQYVDGSADPYNRSPLWTTGYQRTAAYNLTVVLNKLRNYLVNNTDWAESRTQVLHVTSQGIAIMKGKVVTILTNIGSPPQNTSMFAYTPWPLSFSSNDIFSCTQYAVGSNGSVDVQYTEGGEPVVLVPDDILHGSKLCSVVSDTTSNSKSNGCRGWRVNVPLAVTFILFLSFIM